MMLNAEGEKDNIVYPRDKKHLERRGGTMASPSVDLPSMDQIVKTIQQGKRYC